MSHVGFGNGFFLKDCFPNALRVGLVEWFYNPTQSDVDFLPANKLSVDQTLRLRTWNAECLLEVSSLDKVITPTNWQKSQFPSIFREKIKVLHEGVDVEYLSTLRANADIIREKFFPGNSDVEILTYVSRCFEEYRGFPQAAKVISQLLEHRPNLHVFMVGKDCTAYGNPRRDGVPWSE